MLRAVLGAALGALVLLSAAPARCADESPPIAQFPKYGVVAFGLGTLVPIMEEESRPGWLGRSMFLDLEIHPTRVLGAGIEVRVDEYWHWEYGSYSHSGEDPAVLRHHVTPTIEPYVKFHPVHGRVFRLAVLATWQALRVEYRRSTEVAAGTEAKQWSEFKDRGPTPIDLGLGLEPAVVIDGTLEIALRVRIEACPWRYDGPESLLHLGIRIGLVVPRR